MSSLSDYPLEFLDDMPLRKPARVGRTLTKMSKSTNTPEAVKTPKAKYSKTRGEHFKDLVIAVLVAGIIAFVCGMQFQSKQQDAIETAVKGAHTVQAQAPVKK